jgi:hypothetical protein
LPRQRALAGILLLSAGRRRALAGGRSSRSSAAGRAWVVVDAIALLAGRGVPDAVAARHGGTISVAGSRVRSVVTLLPRVEREVAAILAAIGRTDSSGTVGVAWPGIAPLARGSIADAISTDRERAIAITGRVLPTTDVALLARLHVEDLIATAPWPAIGATRRVGSVGVASSEITDLRRPLYDPIAADGYGPLDPDREAEE